MRVTADGPGLGLVAPRHPDVTGVLSSINPAYRCNHTGVMHAPMRPEIIRSVGRSTTRRCPWPSEADSGWRPGPDDGGAVVRARGTGMPARASWIRTAYAG